jgi:hypothetical protein
MVAGPVRPMSSAGQAGRAVDATTRAGYAEVAARRRTVPPAIAVGMVDPAARVVRLSTDDGERFVEEAEVEAVRRQLAVLAAEPLEPVPLSFGGRRARELGFVQLLASSVDELARGLGVPERALAAGPSAAGGWKATRVTLSGGITPQSVERTKSRIERAIAQKDWNGALRIGSRTMDYAPRSLRDRAREYGAPRQHHAGRKRRADGDLQR